MHTRLDSAQLILHFGMIASSIYGKSFFNSDDYKDSEQLTRHSLNKLIPYCDDFVGIIKGYISKCDVMGFIRTMSFPKRFMKSESIEGLSKEQKEELERRIEQTFFLGLTFHLFSWKMPTRKEVDKVNFDNVIIDWLPKTMLADKKCKSYNKDMNNLPKSFFSYYYDRLLEPFVQNELNFGYLKCGECYAYFHNIFYAGVLLGVHFDVAISQAMQR